MARNMICVEMRPLPNGEWNFEDHRAIYEGDVEVTFRHPNPWSRMRPRRTRIPMMYIMHIPPNFVFRHGTPPPPPRRFPRRTLPPSPSPSEERIILEVPAPSRPSTRARSRTPVYVPSDPAHEEEEEDPIEDEDPVEDADPVADDDFMDNSTGSQWGTDD